MVRIALSAAVLLMAGVSGCMTSPRVVAYKPGVGGVVAVSSNSNSWPNYNHDEAIKKIKELYPNFDPRTDLVEERMYDPQRSGRLMGGTTKPYNNDVVAMMNTPSGKEEYRIAFVVKQQPVNNTSLNRGGGSLPEIQRVNGLLQPVPPPVGGGALSPSAPVTPASYNTPASGDPLLRGAFPPSPGNPPLSPPVPPSAGLPSSPAAGVGYPGPR